MNASKARSNLVAGAPTARQTQDVIATVEVDPAPVVIGQQVTISGTITNNTAEDIGIEPQTSIQHGADGQIINEGLQSFNVSSTTIPANGGSITYSYTYGSAFTNQLSPQTQSVETYFVVLGTPVLAGSQSVNVVTEAPEEGGFNPGVILIAGALGLAAIAFRR